MFELVPDVTKLDDFPNIVNDETIADYFEFDELDRENIQTLHRKNYIFTPTESHQTNGIEDCT